MDFLPGDGPRKILFGERMVNQLAISLGRNGAFQIIAEAFENTLEAAKCCR